MLSAISKPKLSQLQNTILTTFFSYSWLRSLFLLFALSFSYNEPIDQRSIHEHARIDRGLCCLVDCAQPTRHCPSSFRRTETPLLSRLTSYHHLAACPFQVRQLNDFCFPGSLLQFDLPNKSTNISNISRYLHPLLDSQGSPIQLKPRSRVFMQVA